MSNGTGQGKPRWAQYMPQLQRANWSGYDGRRRPAAKGPAAGGPPASMSGAGAMIDEQGPTQAGGTLAGITAPGVSRDIIQSRFGPRIDLGPILRPRSTGANPLTGDPFQATSGFGGFFRRLLGDNADELNAQWQQARIANQLAAQGKADERAFELEKLRLADQLAGTREAAGREFQAGESAKEREARTKDAEQKRVFDIGQAGRREQFDLESEGRRSTDKIISDAQQRQFDMQLQNLRGAQALEQLAQRNQGPEFMPLSAPLIDVRSGQFYAPGDVFSGGPPVISGRVGEAAVGGAAPATQGGVTDDQRNAGREKMAALKQQQELASKPILEMGPPSPAQQFDTAMSGLAYADRPALEQAFAQSALQRAEFAPTQIGGSRLYRDPASALESRTPAIMEQFQALPTETQMDIYRSALSGIEGLSPEALRGKSKKAQIKPLFQLPFTLR